VVIKNPTSLGGVFLCLCAVAFTLALWEAASAANTSGLKPLPTVLFAVSEKVFALPDHRSRRHLRVALLGDLQNDRLAGDRASPSSGLRFI
jgi:hypothetical protein